VYRRRIKIIGVSIIIAVMSSCSSIKISDTEGRKGTFEVNKEKLLERVKANNIIKEQLAINKIAITYKERGKKRRFKANLKYNGADSMLISIRTFAGIEAARVLIKEDSIKIIDRINKIMYIGETDKIVAKYGVNKEFIDLFFGDIIKIEIEKRRLQCKGGIVEISEYERNKTVDYYIDCNINKIVKVEGHWGVENQNVKGTFSNFRNDKGFMYPGSITWLLDQQGIELEVEMENLARIENTNILFSTGKGYSITKLR